MDLMEANYHAVIFSHIGMAMAAEASVHDRRSNLGRLEETRNGLSRGHTSSPREREDLNEINCLACIVLEVSKCIIIIILSSNLIMMQKLPRQD